MKKKFTLLAITIILLSYVSNSQHLLTYADDAIPGNTDKTGKAVKVFEFKAYSKDSELADITSEMAGSHSFGDLTAKKLYLLDQKYTSEVPVVPGNPQTRTLIKKPVIYDAVKKIEKDLKKSVKKGDLPQEAATDKFNKVLDIALNLITANTDSFEEAIYKASSIDSKIDLFTRQVVLIY